VPTVFAVAEDGHWAIASVLRPAGERREHEGAELSE